MEPLTIGLVFLIGIAASFVHGISGSGAGLIIVPSLILLGLPPHVAIATSRLGGFGAIIGQTYKFQKAKKIVKEIIPALMIISAIGAFIGRKVMISLNEELLSTIIGIVILLALPTLFIKQSGLVRKIKSKKDIYKGYFTFSILTFYIGVMGISAGVFNILILIHFFGLTFIQSQATKNVVNVVSISVSLILLYFAGYINFIYGAILILGMIIGGYTGAHTAVKKGDNFVRYAFAAIVIISAIKLLFF